MPSVGAVVVYGNDDISHRRLPVFAYKAASSWRSASFLNLLPLPAMIVHAFPLSRAYRQSFIHIFFSSFLILHFLLTSLSFLVSDDRSFLVPSVIYGQSISLRNHRGRDCPSYVHQKLGVTISVPCCLNLCHLS